MKTMLLILASGLATLAADAQSAQLVFNSVGTGATQHPWVVFDPDPTTSGCYLVIDNPTPSGITQLGTLNTAIIKSEKESNKIRWITGTGASGTGNHVIPFSTGSGVAMPLTVNIVTAGSGGTNPSLVFSTYNYNASVPAIPPADNWNNNVYRPSDVTHMLDAPTGSVNNSSNAVDRFWIIDAGETGHAYGTKPAVSITFAYDPLEAAVNGTPGNTAGLASVLRAQRFNNAGNMWNDIPQMGTTGAGVVSNAVPPTTADFFRSWTLASSIVPLPIQLLGWRGSCQGTQVLLTWSTASEKDNALFTIEKSANASDWDILGTLPGAGNSSGLLSYSFEDVSGDGPSYYRLRQTDDNGSSTWSDVIAVACTDGSSTEIVNAWSRDGRLHVDVRSDLDGTYDMALIDVQGRVLTTKPAQAITPGRTMLELDTRDIAAGIYVVRLSDGTVSLTRRVHLD